MPRHARITARVITFVMAGLIFATVAEIGLVLGYPAGRVLLVLYIVGALSGHAFLPSETTTTQQEE